MPTLNKMPKHTFEAQKPISVSIAQLGSINEFILFLPTLSQLFILQKLGFGDFTVFGVN